VKLEGPFCGALFESGENGLRGGSFAQIGFALIAADGDEMEALAAIKLRREAGTFAVNRHTRRQYIRLDKTWDAGKCGSWAEKRQSKDWPLHNARSGVALGHQGFCGEEERRGSVSDWSAYRWVSQEA